MNCNYNKNQCGCNKSRDIVSCNYIQPNCNTNQEIMVCSHEQNSCNKNNTQANHPNLGAINVKSELQKTQALAKELFDGLTTNQHYMILNGPHGPRTILTKSGAEIVARVLGWRVEFYDRHIYNTSPNNDQAGQQVGISARLLDKHGEEIGQGLGGRALVMDGFILNNSYKMAAKSAFVDVVLRVSGLSDFLSQDFLDEEAHEDTEQQQTVLENWNGLDAYSHPFVANEGERNMSPTNNEPIQEAAPAQNGSKVVAPTQNAKAAKSKTAQAKELAQHKQAVEQLLQLAGDDAYDLPAQFSCDSLEEMSLPQLAEAKEMVVTTQVYVAANQPSHDNFDEDDIGLV